MRPSRYCLVAILVATVCSLPSLVGAAERRAPRPAVCVRYSVLESSGQRMLVCLDGKRPSVWAGAWTEVTLAGQRLAVGYRSAP